MLTPKTSGNSLQIVQNIQTASHLSKMNNILVVLERHVMMICGFLILLVLHVFSMLQK